ncbi:hypothetical protein Tsubulata_028529 [Turnera subulata]|uniref:RING-type E3 ubiquitin transferase n=1 Tax=Turnera subulata TaxID=218843 RepID=A0A9Q0FHK8_9ROSI|nr:hypothetical protein Tsubulata_028529 [Turnera subulata]
MGFERSDPSSSGGDPGPSGQPGPSTSATGNQPQRFPLAAQPEIMRAAEKDDQYASYVYDACRDAVRQLFGTRVAVAYQSETKLLGQMLYYVLTTGSGQQTLGEEYCDITQVAGPHGLSPTPARRALFIVYQTAVPYIAERISSRLASQGIALDDAQSDDEPYGDGAYGSSRVALAAASDVASPSTSGSSVSTLSRLKLKFIGLWLRTVRRWPTVCLRRSNLSSIATSVHRASLQSHQTAGGRGLPILNEEGNFIPEDGRGSASDSASTPEVYVVKLLFLFVAVPYFHLLSCINARYVRWDQQMHTLSEQSTISYSYCLWSCVLLVLSCSDSILSFLLTSKLLSILLYGFLILPFESCYFCRNCIMEWCNEKPECPLCRTPITHSSLVCLYHSDF